MKKEPLIILTGPTAVGKTELSIALAKADILVHLWNIWHFRILIFRSDS